MWQPIETAPKDQFLLLCGPSGYTTIPFIFTTGRTCSDYRVGRWIDHANDDLTDWGFTPTHWAPLILPGAQPAPVQGSEGVSFIDTSQLEGVVSTEIVHSYPPPSGWLRAIDEALVVAHIGVANADDTYEQAKAKLDSLIGFHVDVATDPAVNGGWKLVPVEPTKKMIKACTYMLAYDGNSPQYIWAAMLAAVPETKP